MPIYFTDQSNSGVPAGTRKIFFDLSRWLRFAPPPAKFRRPSGEENNIAEFASSISGERLKLRLLQSIPLPEGARFLPEQPPLRRLGGGLRIQITI